MQLFHYLWLSDAMSRNRLGSTLGRVMVPYPRAPSHYLTSWLFIKGVLWHLHGSNFTRGMHELNPQHMLGDYTFEIVAASPKGQSSYGQHGAHLGPVGPRWAPLWPHETCYQGWVQRAHYIQDVCMQFVFCCGCIITVSLTIYLRIISLANC